MNRVAAISSAIAVLAFAGAGHAESLGMNTPTGIENTLRSFNGTNFDVQRISNHGEADDTGGPRPFMDRSSADVHMIRAAIAANAPLTRRLSEQDVHVQDIINADQAADGSITFYYR